MSGLQHVADLDVEPYNNTFEESKDRIGDLVLAQSRHYPSFYAITDRPPLQTDQKVQHQAQLLRTLLEQCQAMALRFDRAKAAAKEAKVYVRTDLTMEWLPEWKEVQKQRREVRGETWMAGADEIKLSIRNEQVRSMFLRMAEEVLVMEQKVQRKMEAETRENAEEGDHDLISLGDDC
jgi:hypothetical protein